MADSSGHTVPLFWVVSQGGTHLEGFLVDPTTQGAHPAIVLEIVDNTSGGGTHAIHADAFGSVSPVVTVTLTDAFPNSDPNHSGNDVITINGLTVVATDASGNSTSAALGLTVVDDAPVAHADTDAVAANQFTAEARQRHHGRGHDIGSDRCGRAGRGRRGGGGCCRWQHRRGPRQCRAR